MNKIIKILLKHNFETIIKDDKHFLNVIESKNLFESKGINIAFDEDSDMQLAVFRIKGQLYCFSNICPHRHAEEIFNGIVQDMQITCPMHGWTYFIESGKNINPKQGLKCLKKYEIFETDGKVYVEKPALEIPKWRDLEKVEE